jgi:protein-disulfide isomerase
MANNEIRDTWADRRLSALDPPASWQPDPTRALARFRDRQKAYRTRRTRWTFAALAASVTAVAAFLLVPAPCSGAGCAKPGAGAQQPALAVLQPQAVPPRSGGSSPVATPPAIAVKAPAGAPPAAIATAAAQPMKARAAAPGAVPARPATPSTASAVPNFRQSGSVLAPVTCEFFTDYQCPHCAAVFLQTLPEFVQNYVRTGKVKLIHRDFPLPQHQYARLAARYANAAGELGYFDPVVNRIFRTQIVWAESGDVDTQVAQVLAPSDMEKLRVLLKNGDRLDQSVAADIAIGRQDQLDRTPTMVVVYKGKRQRLAPIPPYELLKSYIDDLLAK